MDTRFVFQRITFIWDENKARENSRHHNGITFKQAAEHFLDPFLQVVDASRNEEALEAIIGMDTRWNLLFVIHTEREEDAIRCIAACKATRKERNDHESLSSKIRRDKQRPQTTIFIRFPVDVFDEPKRVAPLRGFSGYQPLIRAYMG
jgi:uncharacterized DUF497 family protein